MSTLETPSPRLTSVLFRITADQYHEMIATGIVPEGSPTELLDGMIVYKDRSDCAEDPMAHGPKHGLAVRLLTKLASRIDSDRRHFQVQLPIHLSSLDEPEPDGAIITGPDEQFENHLPVANDVACVIEIAHSSLERDSEDKYVKYARAGIPQYVIVNLRDTQVEAYSQPDIAMGTYTLKTVCSKADTVRLHLGDAEFLEFAAAEILP
jgi:Uma2 family endonuclease